MSNDLNDSGFVDLTGGVTSFGAPLMEALETESHELWRVVSADGSTRIFQTRPTSEPRPGKRTPVRRAVPCPLDSDLSAAGSKLLDRSTASSPVVVAEPSPVAAAQSANADSDLSVELTTVTQAWPTLSPGIRGAVMALIRAAATGRGPKSGIDSTTPRK